MRRVVISGLGVASPIGVGKEAFWSAVMRGQNGVTTVPQAISAATPGLRSRAAAGILDERLPTQSGARCGRVGWLGGTAFDEALRDARLTSLNGTRSAIVFGTAIADTIGMERSFRAMDDGASLDFERAPPHLLQSMQFHPIAAQFAQASACGGPVIVISTGCTAGIDAVGLGLDLVRNGTADIAVCGAADAPLTPVVFAAFDVIGALSKRQLQVETASRPFDRDRDGFVLGEGAAALVLEARASAEARGVPFYAEVSGYASISNGFHMTALPPDGTALASCFELALEDASVSRNEIDHVNAHGSSTPQNDICETNCIKAVLGQRARGITVNSLKAMVGHALGASNAIELVACALSLAHQFVFPTINLEEPGPGCDLDYVANRGRKRRLRHIAKLSNGFSGIHSTMVLSGLAM